MKTKRYLDAVMAHFSDLSPALAAYVEAVQAAIGYDVETPGYSHRHWVTLINEQERAWNQLTQAERDTCNDIGRAILEGK